MVFVAFHFMTELTLIYGRPTSDIIDVEVLVNRPSTAHSRAARYAQSRRSLYSSHLPLDLCRQQLMRSDTVESDSLAAIQ